MDIKSCLEKGHLQKIEPDEQLVKKELNEATYDLEKAEKAFKEINFMETDYKHKQNPPRMLNKQSP